VSEGRRKGHRQGSAAADTPRPSGHEKLSVQDHYRVRQGDYRVVHAIDDVHRIVTIVKIGHRREVHR